MKRSSSTRLRTGAALASTAAALLFAFATPAFGGEKAQSSEHRNDRAVTATSPAADDGAVTEDTDNDGTANNIVDDGDNLHPSGKDRSVEAGGSGDQGNSASTPDQDGHGPERDYQGTDKPGGPGGIDVIDQDRNNGCGNDDDFEDDNEGWCGHKPKPETPPVTPPAVSGETEKPKPETETAGKTVTSVTITPGAVLGSQLQAAAPAPIETQVMGLVIERAAVQPSAAVLGASAVRGASLARTGFDVGLAGLLALGLLAFGAAALRLGRKGEHVA